jgi:hypothetical protein
MLPAMAQAGRLSFAANHTGKGGSVHETPFRHRTQPSDFGVRRKSAAAFLGFCA